MPDQIFISYRRDDAAYVTGHINDLLRKEFGDDAVFTDVDNIALGVDFRSVLDETVSQCHVLLAVIGSTWLSARDQDGKLRLQDPADYVRVEIESALKRNIPVIPLLIGGAVMPKPEELPESLRSLAYRNGMPVRPGPDFSVDMSRLIKSLHRFFAIRQTSGSAEPELQHVETTPRSSQPEKKQAAAKAAAQKRPVADLRIAVDADDRERRNAEIGEAKRKARRAQIGGVLILAVLIGGGAYWFFSGDREEPVENESVAVEPPATDPPLEQATLEEPAEIEAVEPEAIEVETASEEPVQPDPEPPEELEKLAVDAVELPPTEPEPAYESEPVVEAPDPPAANDVPAMRVDPQPGVSEFIGEGVRFAAVGDHEAAIRNFDEALAIDPTAAFVYKQRGASYQALRNYEAAIRDFDEVIRLNSEDVNAYYRRGASYLALSEFAAAIADFDTVIELDPEYVDAYARRAIAHEALGNDEAAASDRAVADGRAPRQ
jgi:tetratricopeptide (TPR) repeat protein